MRRLWISVGFCIASLILFTAALVFRAQDQNRLEDIAKSTNVALCAFKVDLERRYVDGLEFLARNPDGIPGITAEDIRRSLANQKATLRALADLKCK